MQLDKEAFRLLIFRHFIIYVKSQVGNEFGPQHHSNCILLFNWTVTCHVLHKNKNLKKQLSTLSDM